MVTPFVTLGLFFVIAIWVYLDGHGHFDRVDIALGGCLLTIAAFLSFVVGLAIANIGGELLPQRMDASPSHVAELAALRTVDSVSGTIAGGVFMLHGQIDGVTQFRYFERDGAAVTPRSLKAGEGVYVYEIHDGKPRVEEFVWHFTRRWMGWFFVDPEGRTTHFYVPAGSVMEGIQVTP